MLIRFSFKNFKSFKNENCLDMEATSLKEHEYNIAKTKNGDYMAILTVNDGKNDYDVTVFNVIGNYIVYSTGNGDEYLKQWYINDFYDTAIAKLNNNEEE